MLSSKSRIQMMYFFLVRLQELLWSILCYKSSRLKSKRQKVPVTLITANENRNSMWIFFLYRCLFRLGGQSVISFTFTPIQYQMPPLVCLTGYLRFGSGRELRSKSLRNAVHIKSEKTKAQTVTISKCVCFFLVQRYRPYYTYTTRLFTEAIHQGEVCNWSFRSPKL